MATVLDAPRRLGVVLTSDRGLRHWDEVGSLGREVALYRRLAERGWDVTFFTYDRRRRTAPVGFDATTVPQWPFVLPRRLGGLYRALFPVVRHPRFTAQRCDVLLTNQAHSGWPAVVAGKLWGAKVIARCGWLAGEHAASEGARDLSTRVKVREERFVLSRADRCVVPTAALASWVVERYGVPAEKVVVIPNYVDTARFRPLAREPVVDVVTVGRLLDVKRHELLIEALAGTGLKLRIIGSGRLRRRLEAVAQRRGVALEVLPRVAHEELPAVLAEARVYAALSRWEGHPKALLEAMACGLPCVGTDAPGVRDVLDDGRTGLLAPPTPEGVRRAILELLADPARRRSLGEQARREVEATASLEVVLACYERTLQELVR